MKYFIGLLLFIYTAGCAQNEGKIWYFGDGSGIDFNTPTPTVLTNGSIFTYDNSSAVSNNSGQLLFYTNGVTVWNSSHNIMTNGSGLNGNTTGGQSALILRKPNSDLYYIFTVPNHGTGGLYYSIVDMTLAGGAGQVTIKNQVLHTPTTEKLAAHFDCSQNRFWLISHKYNSNEFYSYGLTANGLNTTPIVSATGNIHSGGNPSSSHDAMGQMTLSPNGQLLACAQQYNNAIQIFDFNGNNGQVSNPRTLIMNSPWGLAFSPNSTKLYVTHWLNTSIEQIDLSTPNNPGPPVLIGTVTGTSGGYGAGYLELAPDNKIYIAKWSSTFLSTIDQPNLQGLNCQFNDYGLYLYGKLSQAGLCRTLTYPSTTNSINAQQFCGTTTFNLADTININSVFWNFGDGTTSTTTSPQHNYTAGNYTVSAIISRCNFSDTIYYNITIPTIPIAQIQVSTIPCTNTIQTTNLSSNSTTYFWEFGDGNSSNLTNPNYTYSSPGTYTITLISSNGNCSDTTTQTVALNPTNNYNLTLAVDTCSKRISINWQDPTPTTTQWIINNQLSDTTIELTITITENSPIQITGIANPGTTCADTSVIQFDPSFLFAETTTNYNVFSPNGDNINDCFQLKDFFNCETSQIQIFNRWGKKVYQSSNSNDCWEGKNDSEGTYFLIAKRPGGNSHYTVTLRR
jgi:gliding motility-associated-like protein